MEFDLYSKHRQCANGIEPALTHRLRSEWGLWVPMATAHLCVLAYASFYCASAATDCVGNMLCGSLLLSAQLMLTCSPVTSTAIRPLY